MSDRPTPETDAKVSFRVDVPSCVTVPVDLARKLERERDEAREEAGHWKTEYEIVVDRLRGRKHPRDNGIIADDEIIPKLERERDEAREQATEQFIAAGKAREQAAKWLARLQEEGLEEYGN